jgi:hypothetical protein
MSPAGPRPQIGLEALAAYTDMKAYTDGKNVFVSAA